MIGPFVLINKQDLTKCQSFKTPREVAIFLLGRRTDNYCILFKFEQVITLESSEITKIQEQLEEIQKTDGVLHPPEKA